MKLFSVLDGSVLNSVRGGEVVSAVFTMAYHVVADHGRVDCMVQPTILSTLLTLDDDRLLDTLSAVSSLSPLSLYSHSHSVFSVRINNHYPQTNKGLFLSSLKGICFEGEFSASVNAFV